jgi:hypothetical protein
LLTTNGVVTVSALASDDDLQLRQTMCHQWPTLHTRHSPRGEQQQHRRYLDGAMAARRGLALGCAMASSFVTTGDSQV